MVRPCAYADDLPSLRLLKQYFPDQKPPPDRGCFELSIAVAGGISTGGYLAGVFDFLVEALDAYAAAQAADPAGAPTHKVKLVNLTGTSAGGLSAALAATCLLKDVPHVYDDAKWTALVAAGLRVGAQTPQLNPLYAGWVQLVDLEGLLATPTAAETDISVFAPLPAKIGAEVLAMLQGRPARAWPDWADRPLDLRLMFGNLRGVPYALNFDNVPDPKAGERLTLHKDQVAFSVSPDGADGAPDSWSLSGGSFNAGPAWTLFQAAAVASSAIPGVFAPEAIRGQNIDVYQWRDCWFDTELNKPMLDQPFWQTPPVGGFDFTATDGGLFDNEPFDVAHRALAGATAANLRPGSQANRAVVLVAPYVDDRAGDPIDPLLQPPPPPKKPPTPLSRLASAAWRIFNSPIEQSRWDAFDLALIKSEDVFSRYMIAPSRENPNPAAPPPPNNMVGPSRALMSWPLNLGIGFAAEAYRHHDFLLGRRNAQRFLSDSFMLPGDNPIINTADAWEPTDTRPGPAGTTTLFYPIVPLRGAVHQDFEEPLPAWSWQALTDAQIGKLTNLFGARVDNAWGKIKASLGDGSLFDSIGLGLLLGYLEPGWIFLRGAIVGWFKNQLTDAKAKLDPAKYPPPDDPS
jgi:predicted acylesterase/phospholipase RssA